ncbi:DUF1697 domain-containing protein [Flavobacterium polysaccharolyticum]|uniref:DUF1697 domain-containing protein n=1 Tax=Flavobacterium polysaccharolyticum TaxID=3133148 RepID=A0ABU9NR42_9FLAO
MIAITGFLRGINVGGHHKVPMAELRDRLNEVGCINVRTLLNTGNFVFDTTQTNIQDLENNIEDFISKSFGFPIPVILKTKKAISDLVEDNPFMKTNTHRDIRLYVSFLKDTPKLDLTIPYLSADKSYKIISIKDKTILSVLDLSTTKTPKGMDELEKLFGKNITTRNWNTIKKVNDI